MAVFIYLLYSISLHLLICLSVHPSIHTSVPPSIHTSTYTYICPFIHPSIFPSTYSSTHPPIHVYPPIHFSISFVFLQVLQVCPFLTSFLLQSRLSFPSSLPQNTQLQPDPYPSPLLLFPLLILESPSKMGQILPGMFFFGPWLGHPSFHHPCVERRGE